MRSGGGDVRAEAGRSGWRVARTAVVAAGLYAVAGLLTLWIAQSIGLAAPVWPAAGIAFALVYQRGWPVAIGVAAGSFVVNARTLSLDGWDLRTVAFVGAMIGLGAALQAVVGAQLVGRGLGQHLTLNRGGQVLMFLLFAGPVATLVNPTFGVMAELWAGIIDPSDAFMGWATWWVGDAIGVIVFAPLVLMFLPEQADIWKDRRWKVAVPSLTVTFVLLAVFMQNRMLDQERIDLRRDQLADAAVASLEDTIDQHAEVLHAIEAFEHASVDVTAEEFREFTEDALRRFPNLQAVSWNPSVPSEDLAAFEAEQRVQPGLQDYTVTERTADGELVPVARRPFYVAVGYIEPVEMNRAALGFDINSNPLRRGALERARDTAETTSTAPVELVQETGSQQGMLTLTPVFARGRTLDTVEERRDALHGFAVGVYRLGDMLVDTFEESDWDGIDLRLTDVTDEPVIIGHRMADGTLDLKDADTGDVEPTVRTFDVNGRDWQLEVRPGAEVVGGATTGNAPLLLFGTMMIIGLLEAFLLLVTGMERLARRRAESADFQAAHDPLTALLNRRGFTRGFTAALDRTDTEGSPHVLLFLDLDDFKPVNDTSGHETGDELLRQIAAAMRHTVRHRDIIARIGGDEFAVVLNDCGVERGLAIAEELRAAIAHATVRANGIDHRVGVSIGAVAITAPVSASPDEFIRRADAACYWAKREGGGVRLADGEDCEDDRRQAKNSGPST